MSRLRLALTLVLASMPGRRRRASAQPTGAAARFVNGQVVEISAGTDIDLAAIRALPKPADAQGR